MIDTLFFLLQIVGFFVLLGWAVIHDHVTADGPTAGPLAYKPGGKPDGADTSPSRERRQRTGLTRPPGDANLKDRRR